MTGLKYTKLYSCIQVLDMCKELIKELILPIYLYKTYTRPSLTRPIFIIMTITPTYVLLHLMFTPKTNDTKIPKVS